MKHQQFSYHELPEMKVEPCARKKQKHHVGVHVHVVFVFVFVQIGLPLSAKVLL